MPFSPGLSTGHLRAFSTQDGHLLWGFDTARNYIAVNGVPAKGGSIEYSPLHRSTLVLEFSEEFMGEGACFMSSFDPGACF